MSPLNCEKSHICLFFDHVRHLHVYIYIFYKHSLKYYVQMCQKITKIVATRCHILRLKCTKFDFGWVSAPDPARRAYSSLPDSLAGFNGPTSKGRKRKGREEEKGREGRGREGRRWMAPFFKFLNMQLLYQCVVFYHTYHPPTAYCTAIHCH